MRRGKHLSLEEARKDDKLDQFVAEHPSDGDEDVFDALLGAMVKPRRDQKATSGS